MDLMLFFAEMSLQLDNKNNNDKVTLESNQFWRQTEVVFKMSIIVVLLSAMNFCAKVIQFQVIFKIFFIFQ